MSKKTHWRHFGNNIMDDRTKEQKRLDQVRSFKATLAIDRMETAKPKFNKTSKKEDSEEE